MLRATEVPRVEEVSSVCPWIGREGVKESSVRGAERDWSLWRAVTMAQIEDLGLRGSARDSEEFAHESDGVGGVVHLHNVDGECVDEGTLLHRVGMMHSTKGESAERSIRSIVDVWREEMKEKGTRRI